MVINQLPGTRAATQDPSETKSAICTLSLAHVPAQAETAEAPAAPCTAPAQQIKIFYLHI